MKNIERQTPLSAKDLTDGEIYEFLKDGRIPPRLEKNESFLEFLKRMMRRSNDE